MKTRSRRKPSAKKPGPERHSPEASAQRRARVFDLFVLGATTPQIATEVGWTTARVRQITSDPTFREEVALFRAERLQSAGLTIEAGLRTAIGALVENAAAKGPGGSPFVPEIARERTRSATALLARHFPEVRHERQEVSGTVTIATPSADDLERLEQLEALSED